MLCCGFVSAAEAVAALPTLEALIPAVEVRDDREAFGALADWCRTCVEYPESTLVGWMG